MTDSSLTSSDNLDIFHISDNFVVEQSTVPSMEESGTHVQNPCPIPVIQTVRVNLYPLIEEKISDAILGGINRAFKHTDAPNKGYITECVTEYVMITLSEIFDFGGEK